MRIIRRVARCGDVVSDIFPNLTQVEKLEAIRLLELKAQKLREDRIQDYLASAPR